MTQRSRSRPLRWDKFMCLFQPTARTDPVSTEHTGLSNKLAHGVMTVWSVHSLMCVTVSAVALNRHYQEPKKPALDPVRHKHEIWMKTMWGRESQGKMQKGCDDREREKERQKYACVLPTVRHKDVQTYTKEPEDSAAKPGNPTTNRFSRRELLFE